MPSISRSTAHQLIDLTRPECANEKDDDGDSLVDWPADPGCASELDPTELPDQDLDGVGDPEDNCLTVANPDQRDTNLDGLRKPLRRRFRRRRHRGRLAISSLFKQAYLKAQGDPGYDADIDLDGDGGVSSTDFALFRSMYLASRGPRASPARGLPPARERAGPLVSADLPCALAPATGEPMNPQPSPSLPERPTLRTAEVGAALTAIYNWSYEPEIDQLRTLYANALERQWIALRELDWEAGIDREALTRTFSMGGLPVAETKFWQSLPFETRWHVSRTSAAFMLSNFLHGEQGALMVAGQLVNAVPHMDGKLYAATQTVDEARHVEVFAAYIQQPGPGLPDHAWLAGAARRRGRRARLEVQGGGHAGRDGGPRALLLPRHAQPDPGAAAQEAAHLRLARRGAPHRVRDQVPRPRGPRPLAAREPRAPGLRLRVHAQADGLARGELDARPRDADVERCGRRPRATC